jgi:hypothetical protein
MDKFILLHSENKPKTHPLPSGEGMKGRGNLIATLTPSPSPIKGEGDGVK